jgi:hypothetical protein
MVTDLHTLANNLKHGARNAEDAHIGGGIFSPTEQLELAHSIERIHVLLKQAAQCLESNGGSEGLIARINKELT